MGEIRKILKNSYSIMRMRSDVIFSRGVVIDLPRTFVDPARQQARD